MTMTRVRVLLADDHAILRHALRGMLQQEPDLEVVAEAADGNEALRLAKEHKPNVVVMDIAMPSVEGISATREILAAVPGTKILALSAYAERHFVMRMLEAGASGYLVKTSSVEEMLQGIRAVARGGTYLGHEVAGVVVNSMRSKRRSDEPGQERLGRREHEVLALVAEGLNSQEIASKLHIAVGTVDVHRHNIMRKLGVRSTAELTKYAIRHGLTSA